MTKKKKLIVGLSVSGAVLLLGILALVLCLTLLPKLKIELQVNAAQVDDSQKVVVEWDTSIPVDRVEVSIKNFDGSEIIGTNISNPSLVAKGSAVFDVNYGRLGIDVTVKRHNAWDAHVSKQLGVYADEYVIAPFVATLPVTFFSLNLKQYTNNYTIPTFVWFQRGAAWDYSQLPENVFLIPFGQYGDMAETNGAFEHIYGKTSAWIKNLYEINPNSKFHLYYNDYHPWGWMQATYANGIPTENYDVTLLSDGTASYYAFSKNLMGENAEANFQRMCEDYDILRAQLAQRGCYPMKDGSFKIKATDLCYYVFCMLEKEPNVKLVLANNFLSLNASASPLYERFSALIANKDNPDRPITVSGLYDLLKALSPEEQATIQKLYHFSDTMFEKAKNEGKQIMVLMGTRTWKEIDFDDYVKATMAYYGDDYVYYYKGHPGSPTQEDPDKVNRLNNLGLIDVDSAIAAELIFFFNQDAAASGYGSTTFGSLTDSQAGGIWDARLSGVNGEYKDKVDFAISKIGAGDAVYGQFAGCYLFEFKDTTNYDFAIFNATANSLKYYRNNNGTFVEV